MIASHREGIPLFAMHVYRAGLGCETERCDTIATMVFHSVIWHSSRPMKVECNSSSCHTMSTLFNVHKKSGFLVGQVSISKVSV